jgi:spore coat protein U-like protein
MRKKIFIFSAGLLAVSHISHALQSSSAVLAVTATIASVCSISQNNIIHFGDYDPSRRIIITTNLTVNTGGSKNSDQNFKKLRYNSRQDDWRRDERTTQKIHSC